MSLTKKKLYYMIFSGFAGIIRGNERKLRNVWLAGKIGEAIVEDITKDCYFPLKLNNNIFEQNRFWSYLLYLNH